MSQNSAEDSEGEQEQPFSWNLRFPGMSKLQAERVRDLIAAEFGDESAELYNELRDPSLWCVVALNRTQQVALIAAYELALSSGVLSESEARGIDSMLGNGAEWVAWLDKQGEDHGVD
ncbi:Uncharacterised protein [Mycobacteroides abscessus subsp. abscessus]|nr:Uncharacterised protein [Mycobacteroides abscessus subsp. abscessus]